MRRKASPQSLTPMHKPAAVEILWRCRRTGQKDPAGGGWVGRGGDGGTRMGGRGRERTKESAVMRRRVTGDERTERARDEGTGGGRRRRRWSLPANATRTRTRRRGGRRRRRSARFRRSAGSPCGGGGSAAGSSPRPGGPG